MSRHLAIRVSIELRRRLDWRYTLDTLKKNEPTWGVSIVFFLKDYAVLGTKISEKNVILP